MKTKLKVIKDYLNNKITPDELEEKLPELSWNEWHKLAIAKINGKSIKEVIKELK